MDQIFAPEIINEKYLEKDRKWFAVIMDIKKAERIDRKCIQGAREHLQGNECLCMCEWEVE